MISACSNDTPYKDERGRPYPPAKQMILATMENDLATIKRLYAKGVDPAQPFVEQTGTPGLTSPYEPALHLSAAYSKDLKVLRFFLEQGADPNASYGDPSDARTPLHYAAFAGNLGAIKLLLEKGASIEGTPGNKSTPYLDAAENHQMAVCKYLIERGANGAARNEYGRTALTAAMNFSKFTVDDARFFVEHGADVNALFNIGKESALTEAIRCDHRDIYEYLVSVGADPKFTDRYGNTPEEYYNGKPYPKK